MNVDTVSFVASISSSMLSLMEHAEKYILHAWDMSLLLKLYCNQKANCRMDEWMTQKGLQMTDTEHPEHTLLSRLW